jgi:hypothetical protein
MEAMDSNGVYKPKYLKQQSKKKCLEILQDLHHGKKLMPDETFALVVAIYETKKSKKSIVKFINRYQFFQAANSILSPEGFMKVFFKN